MIGIMLPSVFAVENNVTIEGNQNPTNRSEELYVIRVSPSNENRDIVLSVYDSNRIIYTKNETIEPRSTFANVFIKFFPPLFQDNATYTIEVKGDSLVGSQLITIMTKETSRINETPTSLTPLNPLTESIKNENIPSWIKNNAGWWADDIIDDPTFVNSIEFLIKENIIEVEKSIEKSDSLEQNIPSWIKNNAGWWANGEISEEDFLKGIEFLVNQGIIETVLPDTEIINSKLIKDQNNLLVSFEDVSIPSEELLEICTNSQVLDDTFKQLRMRCDYAMDLMVDTFCSVHGSYSQTLCIDSRVDLFYGQQSQLHNLPEPAEIRNINENISIGSMNFKITSVVAVMAPDSAFFIAFINLELENTGSDTLYVSKNNFQIIDVKGNTVGAFSFARSPQDPIDFNDFNQINQLMPNQKINDILVEGMVRIPQNSILKFTYENMELFVKLIN